MKKWVLIGLGFVLSLTLIYKYTLDRTSMYVPYYHIHDCFQLKYEVEKIPSGVVEMVRGNEYLIMWYDEANRRYAGPKMGQIVSVKWLDRYSIKYPCPQSWRTHR